MSNLAGMYILLGFSGTFAQSAGASDLPEDTVPVFQENDYLFQKLQADYWALSEYYSPQSTNCACSATSAAMALNALRSRVAPDEPTFDERDLVAAVRNPAWAARTVENGGGVTLPEFQRFLQEGLERIEMRGSIEALTSDPAGPTTLNALRDALIRNEASPDSIMLAYYNQAPVTGDPEGGLHVSPIGAYNAEDDRVLLMDVDREFWLPYWTSTETLFEALATPDPREAGALADQTGGCLLISAAA